MKKSGFLAASVAAASATAISASSTNLTCNSCYPREDDSTKKDDENSTMKRSSSAEKFAPRFDGLRFIETLVTAHR